MLVVFLLLSLVARAYPLDYLTFRKDYFALRGLNVTVPDGADSEYTRWISQPLDHFDKNERRTWKMRYFEQLDFWKPGGPIYIFLGGEGQADIWYLKATIVKDFATETNGAMFMSEHRYYGRSKPNLDISKVENLKYLSSKQALADVAKLITELKSKPQFKSSKVVAIGGSYAGNLAAWIRLQYPHLVDAAIASSAPVLAKKDFYEYLEQVNDDYKKYGTPGCLDRIREIFHNFKESFKSAEGIENLKKQYQVCDSSDMTNLRNQKFFIRVFVSLYQNNAQSGPVENIEHHCKMIMSDEVKLEYVMHTFLIANPLIKELIWKSDRKCYNIDYDEFINTTLHSSSEWTWLYQTCTEFGYAQSTTSDNQPFTKFTMTVEDYYEMCTELYGPEFNGQSIEKAIEETNNRYGGLSPNVTKVVFTNSELDPWHRLGVLKDLSDEAPAIFIPKLAHCSDLWPAREAGPLAEVQEIVNSKIKSWIGIEGLSI